MTVPLSKHSLMLYAVINASPIFRSRERNFFLLP